MNSSNLPPAPPIPPHTTKTLESAPTKTLIKILSSWNVKLDSKTFSNRELERRIKLLLSDSQRLSQVLPLRRTEYASLPPWTGGNAAHRSGNPRECDRGNGTEPGTLAYVFSKCLSISQLFEAGAGKEFGSHRETGEDVFNDICQSLMAIARGYDMGLPVSGLQDTRQTSSIALRVVEARTTALDKNLPILFVLFHHETRDNATLQSPSIRWVQHVVGTYDGFNNITSPLDEQHLILRQLIYNSRRLPPGCEAMFEAARDKTYEKHFIPSFLLPLDTLTHTALSYLNRVDLCTECKLAASTLCSSCGITLYCSPTCQRKNYPSHKPFCTRISSSRSITCRVDYAAIDSTGIAGEKISMMNVSRFMSQRDILRGPENLISTLDDNNFLQSRKRRGTKERFVVKIQAPLLPQSPPPPLMIYDGGRTFQMYVRWESDHSAYEELAKLVGNCVRWNGLKVFAYARHGEGEEGKGTLEIMTGVLPDQELFW